MNFEFQRRVFEMKLSGSRHNLDLTDYVDNGVTTQYLSSDFKWKNHKVNKVGRRMHRTCSSIKCEFEVFVTLYWRLIHAFIFSYRSVVDNMKSRRKCTGNQKVFTSFKCTFASNITNNIIILDARSVKIYQYLLPKWYWWVWKVAWREPVGWLYENSPCSPHPQAGCLLLLVWLKT